LSTSPISKLRAANDERRQAERNSLADKLAVEAKALANLTRRPLWRGSTARLRPILVRVDTWERSWARMMIMLGRQSIREVTLVSRTPTRPYP
jgi:hypothetical protein